MPVLDPAIFPCLTLRPGQLLKVTLPDGQALEIDARDQNAVLIYHVDLKGDDAAVFEVSPEA